MCFQRVTFKLLQRLGQQIAFATLPLMLTASAVHAEPLVFYASESGKPTLDRGEGGGNPFASALIELLKRPSLTLSQLPAALRQLTMLKSRDFQSADVPSHVPQGAFSLVPPKEGERRIALVLVVSSYRGGMKSLPGAKHDASRIASALRAAGFHTEIALDLGLPAMRKKLLNFAGRANDSDAAVVYTTGHGMEVAGTVFLLPGDYRLKERDAPLASRALPLPEIAGSLRAKQVNLVFYGGCRDNPFGL